MDKLDDFAREKLTSMQKEIDGYQKDPELCAKLTVDQYIHLAQLQAIYNILSNKTSSNVPAIYANGCKGVQDQLKGFLEQYGKGDPQELYQTYVQIYAQAKGTLDRL